MYCAEAIVGFCQQKILATFNTLSVLFVFTAVLGTWWNASIQLLNTQGHET